MKRLYIVLFALLSLCSCRQAQLKRVRVAPEGVFVSVDTIKMQSFVSHSSYVGTVEADRLTTLNSRHGGDLVEIYVREGQKVRANDPVARIESQSVLSAYEASMATLKQAEDGYERASKVYDSGSVSEMKMVEIRTKLAQAQASAQAAKNALDECTVRAPFSGEISELYLKKGEFVAPGQPVVQLVGADNVEITIAVPESEAYGIKAGDRAVASFKSPELELPATVISRSSVGDRLSHSYKCVLRLDKRPSEILPGMVCKVNMEKDGAQGIVIPSSAVKIDDAGKYVWILDSDNVVSKKRVETGGYAGKGVIVLSGLTEGELLIVEGFSKVSSGMKARVK